MRGVLVSSILFAIVVALMLFTAFALENAGSAMCDMLDKVCEAVKNEHWDKAEEDTAALKEEWEKNEKWITMLVNHNETEKVVENIYALQQYVIYKETPELMATAQTLKKLFEHIPGKERPTLENII